jgi:hypothetical protein
MSISMRWNDRYSVAINIVAINKALFCLTLIAFAILSFEVCGDFHPLCLSNYLSPLCLCVCVCVCVCVCCLSLSLLFFSSVFSLLHYLSAFNGGQGDPRWRPPAASGRPATFPGHAKWRVQQRVQAAQDVSHLPGGARGGGSAGRSKWRGGAANDCPLPVQGVAAVGAPGLPGRMEGDGAGAGLFALQYLLLQVSHQEDQGEGGLWDHLEVSPADPPRRCVHACLHSRGKRRSMCMDSL